MSTMLFDLCIQKKQMWLGLAIWVVFWMIFLICYMSQILVDHARYVGCNKQEHHNRHPPSHTKFLILASYDEYVIKLIPNLENKKEKKKKQLT